MSSHANSSPWPPFLPLTPRYRTDNVNRVTLSPPEQDREQADVVLSSLPIFEMFVSKHHY